ncbi:MAG TPA: CNNM domain-containing protein [Opitutaceae bacterium]|nr:CNNM domain-containing protein [Opitutaceae bacterium]
MVRFLLPLVIVLTVGTSFLCSLFESIVLSTTIAEVEALKRSAPKRGALLETLKREIDATISAVLTLNTVANSLGSVIVGALAAHFYGGTALAAISIGFGAVLLVFSEVLPKNIGVGHRRELQPFVVYPIGWLRSVLSPVTWLCALVVRPFVGPPAKLHGSGEEIILLAERGAQEGTLSSSESSIIANAISLDNVRVSEIMTPRTVVTALSRSSSVAEVFNEYPTLPFGRMPVFGKNMDDIVGVVRRQDLLKAKAQDQDGGLVEHFMQEAQFIPETVTVGNALQVSLKTHNKLLVAVDEFGATAGVVTMEDVIEHLLGREIFEKDDVAVDMRELARAKTQKQDRRRI